VSGYIVELTKGKIPEFIWFESDLNKSDL